MVTSTSPKVTPPPPPGDDGWLHSIDARLGRIEVHIDKLNDTLDHGIKSVIEVTVKGFPNDDPYGHRSYHDEEIEKAKIVQKRKEEVITHLLKTGTWVVLGFIALAVWNYVKLEAQK